MDLDQRKRVGAPKHPKLGGRWPSAPQRISSHAKGEGPLNLQSLARGSLRNSGLASQTPSLGLPSTGKRGRRGKHPKPDGRWTSGSAPQTATVDVAPLKRGRPRKHLQSGLRWTSGSALQMASKDIITPWKRGMPKPSSSPGSRGNSARQPHAASKTLLLVEKDHPISRGQASFGEAGHLRPQLTDELQAREKAYKAALQECEEAQRLTSGSTWGSTELQLSAMRKAYEGAQSVILDIWSDRHPDQAMLNAYEEAQEAVLHLFNDLYPHTCLNPVL